MTRENRAALRAELIRDEGYRLRPYRCTSGALTIGVGRNLDAKGIRDDEAALMLDNDITEALATARTYPWFAGLTDARQRTVVSMIFQLGESGFAKFRATIAAIARGDYEAAARQMLASKVAREQAPARWQRHAERMRQG